MGHLERADAVLAEMRTGATLHLQHTERGLCWVLTNGRKVSDHVARLVVASASVVAVGTTVIPSPPAQIRTCRIAAYGSYLG